VWCRWTCSSGGSAGNETAHRAVAHRDDSATCGCSRHLIERTSERFGQFLTEDEPLVSHRSRVRAHALRHTFGVHSTAAEIPLDVTQQILGHASMATTTIYVQGDRKRRLKEIGKLYREKR
jgi:site-specific recombinase XerD